MKIFFKLTVRKYPEGSPYDSKPVFPELETSENTFFLFFQRSLYIFYQGKSFAVSKRSIKLAKRFLQDEKVYIGDLAEFGKKRNTDYDLPPPLNVGGK